MSLAVNEENGEAPGLADAPKLHDLEDSLRSHHRRLDQ